MNYATAHNSLEKNNRTILGSNLFSICGSEVLCGEARWAIADCIEGNGQFESAGNRVVGHYLGELGSYQIRFKLNAVEKPSNGLSVRFKVQGWAALRYVAIGYTSQEGFQHIKIANPKQDEWLDFSYGFNDLINKIQNRWKVTTEAFVQDLRVYVSGQPELSGSVIEVEAGATWFEDAVSSPETPVLNAALTQAVVDYFLVCHPETHDQAQQFLLHGICPMTGELALDWATHEQRPQQLEKNGTFRYLWHACQPAMKLLVHAKVYQNLPALFFARDIINSWLDSSFYQPDADQKYTWYDHGVAERLLCLLLIQQMGMQHRFDYRFMDRLARAIFSHAQLLESEAFYSCHQSTRYHNHAWFQDVGLMAAAVSYGGASGAIQWFKRGQQRLQDQIQQLVKREKGYAVFIENSSGYHEGIQRLIRFAAQLEQLAHQENVASELLPELEAWSAVFTYPDGRLPAQGDTFRAPNPNLISLKNQSETAERSAVLLPESGYFAHKGVSQKCSWFVGMVATNSSQTHKHQDDTSLVFWLDGIEWLTDPSFYSHDYTDELPAYCRSAAAHNMLSLPARDYSTKPHPDRTTLEYVTSDVEDCRVLAFNRSYQGVEIQRRLRCLMKDDVPQIEVTDSCVFLTQSDTTGEQALETQVVTFHLGDGVSIRELRSVSDAGATVYELEHPAAQRTIQLHLPEVSRKTTYKIEQIEAISGLHFMQSTATTLLQVKSPITTEVKWKIYVS